MKQYPSKDDELPDTLRTPAEDNEDLAAVREAVAEWKAGDHGTPLAEAFEQVRKSHRAKSGQ